MIGKASAGAWKEAIHDPMGWMPCPDPSFPKGVFALFIDGDSIDKIAPEDRKSTRLNSVTNAQLVCRLLLEKKKTRSPSDMLGMYITQLKPKSPQPHEYTA